MATDGAENRTAFVILMSLMGVSHQDHCGFLFMIGSVATGGAIGRCIPIQYVCMKDKWKKEYMKQQMSGLNGVTAVVCQHFWFIVPTVTRLWLKGSVLLTGLGHCWHTHTTVGDRSACGWREACC